MRVLWKNDHPESRSIKKQSGTENTNLLITDDEKRKQNSLSTVRAVVADGRPPSGSVENVVALMKPIDESEAISKQSWLDRIIPISSLLAPKVCTVCVKEKKKSSFKQFSRKEGLTQ